MDRLISDLAREFGVNVLISRRHADLSQEKLAFRAGLHRTEIGKLEKGERLPRIDTVIKLAGALSVASGDLLKGMDWMPGPERSGRFRLRSDWHSRA